MHTKLPACFAATHDLVSNVFNESAIFPAVFGFACSKVIFRLISVLFVK